MNFDEMVEVGNGVFEGTEMLHLVKFSKGGSEGRGGGGEVAYDATKRPPRKLGMGFGLGYLLVVSFILHGMCVGFVDGLFVCFLRTIKFLGSD